MHIQFHIFEVNHDVLYTILKINALFEYLGREKCKFNFSALDLVIKYIFDIKII